MFWRRWMIGAALAALAVPATAAPLCESLFSRPGTNAVAESVRTPLRSRSPFLEPALRLTNRELQWLTLQTLIQNPFVSDAIKEIARHKIQYFEPPLHANQFFDRLQTLSPSEQAISAIDEALRTFRDPSLDSVFRASLIRETSSSRLRSADAVEILLPLSRGVRFTDPSEPFTATDLIAEIASDRSLKIPRFLGSFEDLTHSARHLALQTIKKVEVKSGSANTVMIVTLDDGQRGVFKPAAGERNHRGNRSVDFINFPREVSAASLVEDFLKNRASRTAGLSRIVMPETIEAVVRTPEHSFGVGSLQLFMKGFRTLKEVQTKSPEEWNLFRNTPAWHEIEARARTIDFILGNHDRLPNSYYRDGNLNNIMIRFDRDSGELKAALIDNGLGRPGRFWFSVEDAPLPQDIPEDLAQAVLTFDALGFRQSLKDTLPEAGINDVIERVFALQIRLRRHSKYGPLLKPISAQARGGKIGLLFGTHDPFHEGHFRMGSAALERYAFDEVIFVPNFDPKHKPGATPMVHRLNMIRLRIANETGVNLYAGPSSDLLSQHEGMRKFIDSIARLYRTDNVVTLIGEDAYRGILAQGLVHPKMRDRFAIYPRGQDQGSIPIPSGTETRIQILDRQPENSSTEVRQRIRLGEPVPPDKFSPLLLDYAREFGLYGDPK